MKKTLASTMFVRLPLLAVAIIVLGFCNASAASAAGVCINHVSTQCVGGTAYWFDGCGAQQEAAPATTPCGASVHATINGQYNSITVQPNQSITIAWTTSGVGYCTTGITGPWGPYGNNGVVPTSGSVTFVPTQSTTYGIQCSVSQGSPFIVQDDVAAVIASQNPVCSPNYHKECIGNSVYNYDSCGNQGTLFQACATSQTCSAGACVGPATTPPATCSPNTAVQCVGNSVYWFDSCGTQEGLYQTCGANATCVNSGSKNANCVANTPVNPTCTPNATKQCVGNSVYNYDSCGNQGSIYQTCTGTCSNGSCVNNTTTCTQNSYERCVGGNLYWYDSCGNQGTLAQTCTGGCNGNVCNNNTNTCTQNSYERCTGNNLYWYDSCGNQGTLVQYCQNGCNGNTCATINTINNNNNCYYVNGIYTCGNNYNSNTYLTVQVRDLTTGTTSFSNYINANPGDMLLFLVTIQPSNSVGGSIYLRDMLPPSLIYQDNLVVSGTTNYTGDPINGLQLNNINGSQTITVSYEAQVAAGQNYGVTTTSDNVTVSGPNGTQNGSATININRGGQVLGAATYVSTGLTNYFWTDSFFLPLLIALLGAWMLRMGMFAGVEKWFDSKKKNASAYKAEKELQQRILSIQKSEQA